MLKASLHGFCLLLGSLGLLACMILAVIVWQTESRVRHAATQASTAIDNGLQSARTRVTNVRARVDELKVTSQEVRDRAQRWAIAEAGELAQARLAISDKVQLLSDQIDRVDHWLELTDSSLAIMSQMLAAGRSVGLPLGPSDDQHLLRDLAAMRRQVDELLEPARHIRQRIADVRDNQLAAETSTEIARLVGRLLATIGLLDTLLDQADQRLIATQQAAQTAYDTVLGWLWLAALLTTLLIAWMGLGQGALCLVGWHGLRGSTSAP